MNKIAQYAIDSAEIVGKTVLSAIPIGGALATSIYDSVKNNCLEKRQEKWRNMIEIRLSKIEQTLEQIGSDELFTTALIRTTELAMKTGSTEKMIYLTEALANSAETNIEETLLIIYLDMIDKYTIAHIKMIEKYYNGYTGEENDDFISSKVHSDLVIDSLLLYSNDAHGAHTLSPLGKQFFEFIKMREFSEKTNATNER